MSYSNLYWKDYVISNMFSVPFLLFLIEKGVASFNIKIENMCIKAIWNNDIEFIYEISKYDQRVSEFIFDYCLNYKNNLTNVIICESEELITFFFEKCLNDVESNHKFQTELLITACFFGNYCAVEQLIHRNFIDINSKQFKDGRSPLVLAAESNFVFIVDFLIHNDKIDVNSFDNEHKTSFYYACQYNYVEIVDLLLQNEKVDINIPDNEGKTPFCVACENGFLNIVKRILQRPEADLNTMSKSGSAFGLAVENWHHKVVQILIDSGKIIYQNEGEESPLHRACFRGNLKMVKLLFSIDSSKINKNEIDDIIIYFYRKEFS